MRHLLSAAVLASSAVLLAQLPYGTSILAVAGPIAPNEGLFLADRSGSNVAMTGLVSGGATTSAVSAVALDPIDNRIWIGGATNQLDWIRVYSNTVTQFFPFGTTPIPGIRAITFDDNGNPIVAAGAAAAGGGLFRFDRWVGGVGIHIGAVATGDHNSVCRDPAGNLYLGMFGTGQVHRMLKNPDGSFQPPALVGSIATRSINSITFAPSDGVHPDEIWIATAGPVGSQMFRMPATGGSGVAVGNSLDACSWIDYDRNFNDLLVTSQAGPDRFVRVDRTTGADTQLSLLGSGSVGTLTSNDVDDTVFGAVRVAPTILNGSPGPFTFEIATTAPPGSLALVGTISPFVSMIGWDIVGPNGRLLEFWNITLPGPLAPNSLQFVAAYFDASGNLIVGAPVSWPAH